MFAIIAAVIFALGLLLDLADASISDSITPTTWMLAGLLCLALHLAGVGANTPINFRGRRRGSLRR